MNSDYSSQLCCIADHTVTVISEFDSESCSIIADTRTFAEHVHFIILLVIV
jgi:hypothetical protein